MWCHTIHLEYLRPQAQARSYLLTSTSQRVDGELNRLAAESGCKGGTQGGNGSILGQAVQARLDATRPTRETSYYSGHTDHVTLTPNVHLSHRCKWSSRRAIQS